MRVEIEKVQQWVGSLIVLVVGLAPTVALAITGPLMVDDPGRRSAAIGLICMSAVVGMATIAGMLLIHRRSPLSPWLVLGVVPAAVAAFSLR